MAYKLKRGEFKSWKEVLDLAQRALACDEFVVVSGRGTQNENKCENCDSLDTASFETCIKEEKSFCLECLYDLAAARNRLDVSIREEDQSQEEDDEGERGYGCVAIPRIPQNQKEAEEEYRRNPMIR